MSFRRRAGGGKRDAIEAELIQALQAVGVRCWRLGGTGNADVLTLYRGRYLPLEVKSGRAGRLTRNQTDIPWPVVESVDAAFQAVGVFIVDRGLRHG